MGMAQMGGAVMASELSFLGDMLKKSLIFSGVPFPVITWPRVSILVSCHGGRKFWPLSYNCWTTKYMAVSTVVSWHTGWNWKRSLLQPRIGCSSQMMNIIICYKCICILSRLSQLYFYYEWVTSGSHGGLNCYTHKSKTRLHKQV